MRHPFIIGKLVYLRGVEEDDLEGDYFQWFNDQENDVYTNHAVWPNTPEKMREFYNKEIQLNNDNIILAIIVQDGDKHIGNISLNHINWIDRHARLNIIIGDKEAHSKGYGTEAIRLLVDYGFNKLNLHRIGLGVHENNKAAIRAYEKAGFLVEGRYKDNFFRNGKYSDTICMAILNESTD